MPATATIPEQKRVTISSKRQFTIPQKFYAKLGFEKEAVCTLGEGMLIIEPARSENNGELDEQILSDLIAEGFSGQELLIEFKMRRSKIRPAVEKLLKDARNAAHGSGDYYTYDEVFGGDN